MKTNRGEPNCTWKFLLSVALVTLLVIGGSSTAFAGGPPPPEINITDYSQCSNDDTNDGNGYTTGDTGCRWTFGNLQSNNSTYFEGDATPQRVFLVDVLIGQPHTVTFQYNVAKAGTHAYDFLTDFNFSELFPNSGWTGPTNETDLCDGAAANGFGTLANCTGAVENFFTIPTTTVCSSNLGSPTGAVRIRNGTISDISDPVIVSGDCTGDTDAEITVEFSVADGCLNENVVDNTCPVLIYFGAHISKSSDYAPELTAVNIPGSPYHVAVDAIDGDSSGRRDNQMQAGAVVIPCINPDGTPLVCESDGNPCTVEACNLATNACESTPGNAGTLCRTGSGDVCDPDELCTGVSADCPADVVTGATTTCRTGSGDVCDPDESCPGTAGGACPADTITPVTTVCRTAETTCDVDDSCTGVAGEVCPSHEPVACEAICRTPGFYGTHARASDSSQNITQAIINAGGGSITICGECINATVPINNAASAVEALCVSPSGNILLQNARQLTALALNCIVSGFGADCSGDASLSSLFSDCNNACTGAASTRTNEQCRDEIDCFNNGGQFDSGTGFCQTGTCANGDACNDTTPCADLSACTPLPGNCHDQPLVNETLGLNFEPPGPAGSSDDCNAAKDKNNHCAVLPLAGDCSAKNASGEACCSTDSCP
jgi:hypothetical protein